MDVPRPALSTVWFCCLVVGLLPDAAVGTTTVVDDVGETTTRRTGTSCHQTIEASAYPKTLAYPSFPVSGDRRLYPNDASCEWTVTAPNNGDQIRFHDFDVEDEEDSMCIYDWLEISTIGKWCGHALPGNDGLLQLPAPVTLSFTSDQSGRGHGFVVDVFHLPAGGQEAPCGGQRVSSEGLIVSPGFQAGLYPADIECTWSLPAGYKLYLLVDTFQLEAPVNGQCRDRLTLRAAEGIDSTYCGQQVGPGDELEVSAEGQVVTLTFTTNSRNHYTGFKIYYRVLSQEQYDLETSVYVCGEALTASSARRTLTSPGFAEDAGYPDRAWCRWSLVAPADHGVLLTAEYFDLERSAGCTADNVTLWDADTLVGTFCGSRFPEHVLSKSRNLTLVLTTNKAVSSDGFWFTYEAVPAGTSITTTTSGTDQTDGSGGEEEFFHCANDIQVEVSALCDLVDDCGDGSDEDVVLADCPAFFECNDGGAVLTSQTCNGIPECAGGEDEDEEAGCLHDGDDAVFLCAGSGTYIPYLFVCDGVHDCADGSDEAYTQGCTADPCSSGPCGNGGTCTVPEAALTTYVCVCLEGWTGPTCRSDNDDSCRGKPCANGGTCHDWVGSYRCECAAQYVGPTCTQYVPPSPLSPLTVDPAVGEDGPACGPPEAPCRTLLYGLARARRRGTVTVRSDTPLTLGPVVLTKDVLLRGAPTDTRPFPHLVLAGPLLVGRHPALTTLTLVNLQVSGVLYVGDAAFKARNVTLRNCSLLRESQRRAPVHLVQYTIDNSLIEHSLLTTATQRGHDDRDGQGCEQARLALATCRVVDSLIDIGAAHVQASVQRSVVTGGTDSRLTTQGLYFRFGLSAPSPPQGRAGGGGPGQEEEAGSRLVVRQVTFDHLQQQDRPGQAALTITANASFSAEVTRCAFSSSERAVQVDVLPGDLLVGSVYVRDVTFYGSTSLGPGAAVNVDQKGGQLALRLQNASFYNNYARPLVTGGAGDTGDGLSVSRITGSGGAVAVNADADGVSCVVEISACLFDNNTAENYGGTLYFTPGVTARVSRSTFHNLNVSTNTTNTHLRPRIGDVLESRGNLYMVNNTFNIRTADDDVPILSYRASDDSAFLEAALLTLTCPAGYTTTRVVNAVQGPARRPPVETLLLYCKSCTQGSYTLTGSSMVLSGVSVLAQSASSCELCPYGATCDALIRAKANFWGAGVGSRVAMYLCPDGYCCQQAVCSRYTYCAPHRQGPLCAECSPGHTESLFSTRCIPTAQCTSASAFWAVLAAYGILYVMFFIFEDEIKLLIRKFSGWCRNLLQKCCGKGGEVKRTGWVGEEEEPDAPGAFLQIIMYYVQVSALLQLDILYKGERTIPIKQYGETIKNIFSFNTFGLHLNTCLFKNVTALSKPLLRSGFILFLFLVWVLAFFIGKCINRLLKGGGGSGCREAGRQGVRWVTPASLDAKFTGALVQLLLFTYQYFAENSLIMLKCVTISGFENPVLFIYARVQCYEPWQYIFIGFACVYVFPFFFALTLAPNLLKRRIISIRFFIFSILLPLFSTPILLYKWIKYWKQDLRRAGQRAGRVGAVRVVTDLVAEPYRDDLGAGLCWEGMIALRRLVLTIIATLMNNVLYRHILLMLGCYCSFTLHILFKPFALEVSNGLESVSLGLLLMISIMNLLKASYFDSGDVPQESADRAFLVYDWAEAVLLGVVPLALLGLVVLIVIARLIAFLGSCLLKTPSGNHRQTGPQKKDNYGPRPHETDDGQRRPRPEGSSGGHGGRDVDPDTWSDVDPYDLGNAHSRGWHGQRGAFPDSTGYYTDHHRPRSEANRSFTTRYDSQPYRHRPGPHF